MNEINYHQMKEGRSLEFKSKLPMHSDLAKTAIAFANDAGGTILIGVDDDGKIIGLPEEELPLIEEKVYQAIFDRCTPAILPEVSFVTVDGKNIVKVEIHRGSAPPYHFKNGNVENSTYVRVGSFNRQADHEIIAELERKCKNVPFDSELVFDKPLQELVYDGFKQVYLEKTGEQLTLQALFKLGLAKEHKGTVYPTNALLLLSDDLLRYSMFPYAKIECARFKGTTSEFFIDQKTYDSHLVKQAQDAYEFVLRHINQGAHIEGIFTVRRWEYPVNAIREVIRNAVVHRQYFFLGKDIKIAIFDDMVEITSPGLVPPTINYDDMESRQSDARNKSIALAFKKMGIIDQWGNGLKLIADELKQYPEIELRWHNAGLAFQVQFVKKATVEPETVLDPVLMGAEPEPELYGAPVPASGRRHASPAMVADAVIRLIRGNAQITVQELATHTNLSKRNCERLLSDLKKRGLIYREGSTRAGLWRVR